MAAVEDCKLGIAKFGRFRADAMQHINAAIDADDTYCLPRIVKACMLQGANDERYTVDVVKLIEQSRDLLPQGESYEAQLLGAVEHANRGQGIEAATCLEQVVLNNPTDLFAHVLMQEQTFWLGQSQWMLDTVERAAPAWSESHADYGPFVALRAFANEEAGLFDAAERYGRTAVEIDETDVWGAHAVAHVLVMKGEIQHGVEWLENLSKHWGLANQMRHHLWWHYCLFLLELGEHDRVIELLDTQVRNPESPLIKASPAATIDNNNYASLLLRLELYGVDVSTQWHTLANICAERVANHGSAFSNIHDMMVLTATGQNDKAYELLASMTDHFASNTLTSSRALSYKVVAIPVCEALMAYREKNYAQVLDKLGSVRHQLNLMGASHAQRDVFYHLLIHAAQQEHRPDLHQIFLHDIHRLGYCEPPTYARVGPR